MFSLKIRISQFDCDSTFQSLWPQVRQKIDALESESLPVLLLKRMQDTSLSVLLNILNRLNDVQRNALYCYIIALCRTNIHSALTNSLARTEAGQSIAFSGLRLHTDTLGGLTLFADGIEINYDQLLKSRQAVEALGGKAFLVKMAMPLLSKNQRDRILLNAVRQSKYQSVILEKGNQLLKNAGIILTIADLDLTEDPEDHPDNAGKPIFPAALKNALVDAFADFVRTELA